MEQPAGILPNNIPCGSTIYLSLPKPSARIRHNFAKPTSSYPIISTIDGRLFYSFGQLGVDVVDIFCDSVVFIPYHLEKAYGPEFSQITNDLFIYRVNNVILKIRVDLDKRRMETLDERFIENLYGCSERIVDNRFITYQWSLSREFIHFDLYNINDIHSSLQSFRLKAEPPNYFNFFHIFEDKLYFFSKFDQRNRNADPNILNLGGLHVYDLTNGQKEMYSTTALPIFHYSPPANIIRLQRLFIQKAFWLDSKLYVRVKEVENNCPFYHLIVLDILTLQWRLIADPNIEMKLSALVDENGVLNLINVKPDNKEQVYYRIGLKQPEPLKNLAQFAVMRVFPNLYKIDLEKRPFCGLPPHLPFHPIAGDDDYKVSRYHTSSIKLRLAAFFRRLFN